jgi:hypothetical protein
MGMGMGDEDLRELLRAEIERRRNAESLTNRGEHRR